MDVVTHTLVAFGSIFVAYWVGIFRGFYQGADAGLTEGTAIATKRTLEWCRKTYDINISDLDIEEVFEEIRKS